MSDNTNLLTASRIVDTATLSAGEEMFDTATLSAGEQKDTLDLACEERRKQGPWETEISYGDEGDLFRHYNRCKKNPGHREFIPVDEFNMDHLPTGCQDTSILGLVRPIADLTVRVSVKHVGDQRPETFNDSPYPTYKDRSKNMMRVGTGWIDRVDKYADENRTCSCKECQNSKTPRTQYANIFIHTAAHVVFDDQEAAYTTCHLFYDKGKSVDDCPGIVALQGWSVVLKNVGRDVSLLCHVTHDLDLADKIDKMVGCYYNQWRAIMNSYDSIAKRSSTLGEEVPNARDLIIIVSHPHGCSKKVSVGFCTNTSHYFVDHTDIKYKYTTATCPGSSGAVVRLKTDTAMNNFFFLLHCGRNEDDNRLNYCY